MRRLTSFLAPVLLCILFVPLAIAQSSLPASAPTVDLPLEDALKLLLASLAGLKGAGALGIAAIVTQGILLFFRTKLATFAGKWQLLIVYVLNLLVSCLTLLAAGVPLTVMLVHQNTSSAFQVLLHQVVKQVTEKTDPAPVPKA
jgi:hypothetical protein